MKHHHEEKYFEPIFYEISHHFLKNPKIIKDVSTVRTTLTLSEFTISLFDKAKKELKNISKSKTKKQMIDYMLDDFIFPAEENMSIHYMYLMSLHQINNPKRRTFALSKRSLNITEIISKKLDLDRNIIYDYVIQKYCKVNLLIDKEIIEEFDAIYKLLAEVDPCRLFADADAWLIFNEVVDDKHLNSCVSSYSSAYEELMDALLEKAPHLAKKYTIKY